MESDLASPRGAASRGTAPRRNFSNGKHAAEACPTRSRPSRPNTGTSTGSSKRSRTRWPASRRRGRNRTSTSCTRPSITSAYSRTRLHHPKEEEYLFKALRRRRPDPAALLDEIEKQHAEGGRLITELERALKDYDRNYPDVLELLQEATRTYVDAQREHIGKEEREVLPLARESLDEEDWGGISRAFARNSDPMFGENLEAGFRALFERITRRAESSGS